MDIDTMPAGREMDALVAEKVMGWDICWAVPYKDGTKCPLRSNGEQVPHYSIDIAAAWGVVGKLLKNRVLHVCGSVKDGWDVWIPEVATGAAPKTSKCDTFPLAICRAALKACL